jgi:hypothetical protein
MDVAMLDGEFATVGAETLTKELNEGRGTVFTPCATDGDASWSGGKGGVVGEVVEEFAGTGGVLDDVLDAGV